MGLSKALDYIPIPALRISIFLVHKRDSRQTCFKGREEITIWQIAFHSHPLLPFAVEKEHGRRPHDIETVEPCGMLFNVSFDWEKILVDEVRGRLVFVGLGIQPSACASRRCGAEVHENGLVFFFGFSQRLIHIFAPIHSHTSLLGDHVP
jgi:hypothetical protein